MGYETVYNNVKIIKCSSFCKSYLQKLCYSLCKM
jgi:hypothetical protein